MHELAEMRITGTEVNYYVLCTRKLWWYAHGLEQEHAGGNTGAGGGSAGQENVALGSLLHESRYPDKTRKDILIDGLLRLDFTDRGEVHEVKKSRGGHKAALAQLLYYLYYLKHAKGHVTTGVLDIPLEKRREEVTLTPEKEAEIEALLQGVLRVRALPAPPAVDRPFPLCKQCAYQELCWG